MPVTVHLLEQVFLRSCLPFLFSALFAEWLAQISSNSDYHPVLKKFSNFGLHQGIFSQKITPLPSSVPLSSEDIANSGVRTFSHFFLSSSL